MRVLHVIPSLAARTGGPAFAVAELARVGAGEGIESSVFATDVAYPALRRDGRPVAADELPEAAAEIELRLFPVRAPRRLVYSPGLRNALRDEIDGYDVVHVHSLYLYPQLVAAREAFRSLVPYVVSPHGALDPWLRRRGRLQKAVVGLAGQRRMLERAAALHFTSEEESRLAGDVAPGVPRVIVPIGIRWDRFQQLPAPAAFGDGPVVLTLGRLAAKKGLDVLIRAFALAARDGDALLVIAGPDDEGLRPGLEQLARQEGVGDRVVFPGMLQGEEKLAALAGADVWALPSHTENFGVAVVEALAAGLPTVISPAVNLADEIESAGAGLVSPAEPEPFAAAISGLLADEQRRKELGTRAREFAQRYDWRALAGRWKAMYEQVAER